MTNENLESGAAIAGVSRRAVAKGMAWAVPAVAVASTAPAFAASQCKPDVTFNSATSCKCPGQSTDQEFGYWLDFCVDGDCLTDGGTNSIVITRVEQQNGKFLEDSTGATTFAIDADLNDCSGALFFSGESSPNGLYVHFTFGGVAFTSPKIDTPPNCQVDGETCLALPVVED